MNMLELFSIRDHVFTPQSDEFHWDVNIPSQNDANTDDQTEAANINDGVDEMQPSGENSDYNNENEVDKTPSLTSNGLRSKEIVPLSLIHI